MIQMSRPFSRSRPPARSQLHPHTAGLHTSLCTCARLDCQSLSLALAVKVYHLRFQAASPARAPARSSQLSAVALSCSCLLGTVGLGSRRSVVHRQREEDFAAAVGGRLKRRTKSERDLCARRQRRSARRSIVCGRRFPHQGNVSDLDVQCGMLQCLNTIRKNA
jgi:hypothetical protein